VVDAFSRTVVGWAMADHLRTELVLDAVGMAITTRKPPAGTVHHTDRGSQGGVNWSSQHLEQEVSRWMFGLVSGRCRTTEGRSPRRDAQRWRGGKTGCASGRPSHGG
jgi:transposase InsO family protein